MKCPCCSNIALEMCCLPIIEQQQHAHSPEALMRSRFTAYALNKAEYILATYHSSQQSAHSLADIQAWAEENQWIELIIHQANSNSTPATIEFSAFYLNNHQLIEMRERSNFTQEKNQWRYVDGTIITHEKITSLTSNDPCPCHSGKKYKKCCGNNR
ncbi:YchJ family protein [Colwellia sp. MEBiC06753]